MGARAGELKLQVVEDHDPWIVRAADLICECITGSSARYTLALSGGHTPLDMFAELARRDVDWDRVHVFQTDERVAPDDHPDRNLTTQRDSLFARIALPNENLHVMPVTDDDLEDGAARYERELREVCGVPLVLNVVHLGLGSDGHTASLVPGDAVLGTRDRLVALTGEYRGRRRMTLTLPAINAADRIVWLVSGEDRAEALAALVHADASIPAARVRRDNAFVVADAAAARLVEART